jgi:hypothetical protein
MYDCVLSVIIMVHVDLQDPYFISQLLFITSHCYSAVHRGGWLSGVHECDEQAERKQQRILVRRNNDPTQYTVEAM